MTGPRCGCAKTMRLVGVRPGHHFGRRDEAELGVDGEHSWHRLVPGPDHGGQPTRVVRAQVVGAAATSIRGRRGRRPHPVPPTSPGGLRGPTAEFALRVPDELREPCDDRHPRLDDVDCWGSRALAEYRESSAPLIASSRSVRASMTSSGGRARIVVGTTWSLTSTNPRSSSVH